MREVKWGQYKMWKNKRKKIFFGTILTVFLFIMMPIVQNVNAEAALIKNKNNRFLSENDEKEDLGKENILEKIKNFLKDKISLLLDSEIVKILNNIGDIILRILITIAVAIIGLILLVLSPILIPIVIFVQLFSILIQILIDIILWIINGPLIS